MTVNLLVIFAWCGDYIGPSWVMKFDKIVARNHQVPHEDNTPYNMSTPQ